MKLEEIAQTLPQNNTIISDNMVIAYSTINDTTYNKIMCSISGGSDSDIILDITNKCNNRNNVDYVWLDTGLEYQATKDHLEDLEKKYNIKIKRLRAKKPIPLAIHEYGQPFYSKFVSEMIYRLQKYNFTWEDKSYDELIKQYPHCQTALKWWCNEKGENSRFNINHLKYLKEFIIQNPIPFKVSNKCCDWAKKYTSRDAVKQNSYDLLIVGVRKSEGGIRSASYKNCYSENKHMGCDEYRPIFWYENNDKIEYENTYGITHSACYNTYGLKRTGCAGCVYGRDFEKELEIIKQYEPKLYKAVNYLFKDTYEYTRKYKQFCDEMDAKYGSYSKYLRIKNGEENNG